MPSSQALLHGIGSLQSIRIMLSISQADTLLKAIWERRRFLHNLPDVVHAVSRVIHRREVVDSFRSMTETMYVEVVAFPRCSLRSATIKLLFHLTVCNSTLKQVLRLLNPMIGYLCNSSNGEMSLQQDTHPIHTWLEYDSDRVIGSASEMKERAADSGSMSQQAICKRISRQSCLTSTGSLTPLEMGCHRLRH